MQIAASENPIMIHPYPADKMSLNSEITIQYPAAKSIDKSTVNSTTFMVTDTLTGVQVLGLYQVIGNMISFIRTGGGLWSANRTYSIAATNQIQGVDGHAQPQVFMLVTAVMDTPDTTKIIYEATNNNQGYTAAEVGGLHNADSLCNSDANNLFRENPEYYFKALLGARGIAQENRRWGMSYLIYQNRYGPRDWVLLPNTQYKNINNFILGTTTHDATFAGNFGSTIRTTATTVRGSWSGLNTNWGPQAAPGHEHEGDYAIAADCNGWTGSAFANTVYQHAR